MDLLEKQLSAVYFKDLRFPWVTLYNRNARYWCQGNIKTINFISDVGCVGCVDMPKDKIFAKCPSFESTKQHLGVRRFHWSGEAIVALRGWLRMQSPLYTATEFFDSCHNLGEIALMCWGIMLENNGKSVE